MKKKVLKLSLVLAIGLTLGLVGCSETSSASSDNYTAYLYFNGQYIKYDGVERYSVNSDGEVELDMTSGKEIKLYSPGNVTVVTKDAIPEPPATTDKKEGK